jgi:hypothetical protein
MNDEEIRQRLRPIGMIRTLNKGVRNDILHVGEHEVEVRSEWTGDPRTIPFSAIRNPNTTTNGCIARAFARVLGIISA